MAGIRHLIDTEAHKALFEELRAEFESGLALAMQSAFLPGMVMPFSGSFGGSDGKRPINPHTGLANEGFALCDGGTYQASKSSPLITTPDLRGRFAMGASSAYKAGTTGGGEGHAHTITVHGHTLSVEQMPSHLHGVEVWTGRTSGVGELKIIDSVKHPTARLPKDNSLAIAGRKTDVLDGQGSSQPHAHGAASSSASSLPPYYSLAYIMKL